MRLAIIKGSSSGNLHSFTLITNTQQSLICLQKDQIEYLIRMKH